MSIRIPITLVIEMNDEQEAAYAAEYGLSDENGRVMAKDVVLDVTSYVLTCVQDSPAFGEIGLGDGTRGADVTIKR